MKYDELRNTIYQKRVNLPYGVVPAPLKAIKSGGNIDEQAEITEEDWNNLTWNPPEGHPVPDVVDSTADDKPTWAFITSDREEIQYDKNIFLINLEQEASRRITKAYGAESEKDEIRKRLRNAHTPEQDLERDRLIRKYKELRIQISRMSLQQRKVLDVTSDLLWQDVPDPRRK